MKQDRKVYLDHAATTPLDPVVEEAMRPYFGEEFGNPSSIHTPGQHAQIAVDNARESLAQFLGAKWREIIFTGSATEADNMAVRGVVKAVHPKLAQGAVPHIVTSVIEHKAILEPCRELEKEGVEVTYVPVNKEGIIDARGVENAIKKNTVLVSIMYVNNEIGTVQPIAEIAERIKRKKLELHNLEKGIPYFHTDAVQALQYLDCKVDNLGVDLMTISAHKVYGPKGIGALYLRKETPIAPLVTGGGQEHNLRAGTENVPGIVGFARAVKIVAQIQNQEGKRLRDLQYYMIEEIKKRFPKFILQGSREKRIPNNVNLRFHGISADSSLIALDQQGIYVSTGSACTVGAVEPSHVIMALGVSAEEARQTIRFSMGRSTTKDDIGYVLAALENLTRKFFL